VQTGQLDIPFCINVNPTTQAALLNDIAVSLDAHGIRSLVVVNGHGGNDIRTLLRELQPRVRMFLCTLNCSTPKSPSRTAPTTTNPSRKRRQKQWPLPFGACAGSAPSSPRS
jgi:creatinine amidohydrolase/Fe(II)-dependent formamide hydrolase-like protein